MIDPERILTNISKVINPTKDVQTVLFKMLILACSKTLTQYTFRGCSPLQTALDTRSTFNEHVNETHKNVKRLYRNIPGTDSSFLVFDQNVFLRKNLQVVFSKCSCHFCMFANKLHAMCHLMHHQLQLVYQITRSKMNKFLTNNILKIRCRMLK